MNTKNYVRVTIRIDKHLKERADSLFVQLGMNMDAAFNIFLRKAVDEQAIPFAISTTGATVDDGYTPSAITNAFATAVKNEVVKNRQQGFPVARYDTENKRVYLELPDGTREYISRLD